MKYYHYTSATSLLDILASDKLLASAENKGDAILGDGVYFTRLGPKSGTADTIFCNNWGASPLVVPDWTMKMEACIEIKYEGANIRTHRSVLPRDVYVYAGEDMQNLYQRVVRVHISVSAWETLDAQQQTEVLRKFPGKVVFLQFAPAPSTASSSSSSNSSPLASSSSGSSGTASAVGLSLLGGALLGGLFYLLTSPPKPAKHKNANNQQ